MQINKDGKHKKPKVGSDQTKNSPVMEGNQVTFTYKRFVQVTIVACSS